MDLQTLAAIVGILSGLVTLAGGAADALGRFRKPAPAQAPRVPVQAGAYPYPPPTSNASSPYPSYPQPGSVPPPHGYGWPATPPPPGPVRQRGYPQPGAPFPQPGYGAPPGQRGNAPQPRHGAPYPMPQPAPYAQYAPQPVRRRWFTHPTIAVYAAIALVASGLIGLLSGNSVGSSSSASSTTSLPPALTLLVTLLTLIVIAAYVVSLVLAARQATRLRRWGWLAIVIILVAYGPLVFGIVGPTHPPRRRSMNLPGTRGAAKPPVPPTGWPR